MSILPRENNIPIIVRDFPFGSTKLADPETLHVQDRSRVNDEAPVITLGYWAQLVPKQDCWRLLHYKKKTKANDIDVVVVFSSLILLDLQA